MNAWLSLSLAEFHVTSVDRIAEKLLMAQNRRFKGAEPGQVQSWKIEAEIFQRTLTSMPGHWRLIMEYDLLRLEKRIDAVLITDRAIFAMEFKPETSAFSPANKRQTEDYALDLHDFHAASRIHPIVPILFTSDVLDQPVQYDLAFGGVTTVIACNAARLGQHIAAIYDALPEPRVPLDIDGWENAPYRPIPTVLEAATQLYRHNSVAEIAAARADATNLGATSDAIVDAIMRAQHERTHLAVFVTGIPGAGKTLCGLNVVFGALRDHGAAFLSGNTPLVKVLREALTRDAAPNGAALRRLAEHRVAAALQNVHHFLEHHVTRPEHQPEAKIIVFDEAQRAWDARKATSDSQRRVSQLTTSEPGHALEIMGRFEDWSVIVALIGNGQEINTGEAGLAEWGRVIETAGNWHAVAAPRALAAFEPAQRLADGDRSWLTIDPRLDLTAPMRSIRDRASAEWVEAVINGDQIRAAQIAQHAADLPFYVTRDLERARREIRSLCRGSRRGGLVASSGAKRLRADGLGVQLDEVEKWFLNQWDDIRSSEALETFATEYDCQGLELDVVGLAWGGDLLWQDARWRTRDFKGTKWNQVRKPEDHRFILNTYRVLLTRARYETIIWVPPGSAIDDPFYDSTRSAPEMDQLAELLVTCGAKPL